MPLRVDPRRDRKLNRLVKAAEVRRLRRVESLFEPGPAEKLVYLVRTGHLRVVQPGAGRTRERTVAVVGPWELFWEEGMRSGPRRYRCVSGEPSSVQALDSHAVALVLKSTEQTFEALLDGVARELELTRRLATGGLGPEAAQRLALVVVDLARRWGEPAGKGTLVRQRVTHQVLADLAGAHRSTVTTILNDWLYRGLLAAVPRGLHVAQPDRLARVASDGAASR